MSRNNGLPGFDAWLTTQPETEDNEGFVEGIKHLYASGELSSAQTYWLESIMDAVSRELGKRSEVSEDYPAFIWAGFDNGWEREYFAGSNLYVNVKEHDRRHDALLAKIEALTEEIEANDKVNER